MKKTKTEKYKPEISNYPEEINILDKNYWFNKAKIGYDLHYYTWKNKHFPSIFEFASDSIKNDKELALYSITEGKTLLHQIPENFLSDRNFILEYISKMNKHFSFFSFPEHIQLDEEIFDICFSKNYTIVRDLPHKKFLDKEFIFSLVKKNGLVLEYLPSIFKDDPVFVVEALKNAPSAIRFINKKTATIVCKDVDLIRSVLSQYSEGYQFISSKLRNNIEFSKPYLKNYYNVSFIGKKIKDDPETMLFYAKHSLIFYASDRLRTDSDFMLKAIELDPMNFNYINSNLNNIDFLRSAVQVNCRIYPLLNSFKDDPIILCSLLEHEKILNPKKNIYTDENETDKYLNTIRLLPNYIVEDIASLEFPKITTYELYTNYKEELRLALKSFYLTKKIETEFREKIDSELHINQQSVKKLKI